MTWEGSRLCKLYYIHSPYAEDQHWPLRHVLPLRLADELLQQRLELRESFFCLLKRHHALWTEESHVQLALCDRHFDIERMLRTESVLSFPVVSPIRRRRPKAVVLLGLKNLPDTHPLLSSLLALAALRTSLHLPARRLASVLLDAYHRAV